VLPEPGPVAEPDVTVNNERVQRVADLTDHLQQTRQLATKELAGHVRLNVVHDNGVLGRRIDALPTLKDDGSRACPRPLVIIMNVKCGDHRFDLRTRLQSKRREMSGRIAPRGLERPAPEGK
jgi:hypothetical protein